MYPWRGFGRLTTSKLYNWRNQNFIHRGVWYEKEKSLGAKPNGTIRVLLNCDWLLLYKIGQTFQDLCPVLNLRKITPDIFILVLSLHILYTIRHSFLWLQWNRSIFRQNFISISVTHKLILCGNVIDFRVISWCVLHFVTEIRLF